MKRSQSQRNPMNFGTIYAAGEIAIHVLDSNSSQRKSFKDNGICLPGSSEQHHRRNLLPEKFNYNCNNRNKNNNRMLASQNHRLYYHSQPKDNHKRGVRQNEVNNVNVRTSSNNTGCIINGIKNIYNQFMHPQLRCDFYSDQNRSYNPKHRNNSSKSNQKFNNNTQCSNNKSQRSNHSQMNPNLQNTISNCSFAENKLQLRDTNDRTHEIVAIFTSEDFPELPVPKKIIKDSLNLGKSCTLMGNSNNNLNNKSVKKNKYLNKKSQEDSDLLIDFVIFSSHAPKQTCNKTNKNRTKIRQISECSDDSFICFDNNAAEGIIEFSDDSVAGKSDSDEDETDSDDYETGSDEDETDSSEDETDSDEDEGVGSRNVKTTTNQKFNIQNNKTENYNTLSDGTSQPDSGFDDGKDKKVRFNMKLEIHVMHTWNFAYRAARKGHWETYSRDRVRFKNRIEKLSTTLSTILDINHRENIFKTRFCDN